MKPNIFQLFAAVVLLSHASLLYATQRSSTTIPAEGNKQCSDYSANNVIMQMGVTNPAATGTLFGAENPRDSDTTGESVVYTLTGSKKIAGFSGATTPIDYAILKSGKNVVVIYYPAGGVTNDADMKIIAYGYPQVISSISLCYGLPAPPPPPVSTIPSCADLSEGGIDGIGVTCPSDGQPSIVFNFELNKPFYNTTDSPIACVCNSAALTECDPGVAYDPEHPDNGACPLPPSDYTGTEVTTHIELNNDPYACTTVGGTRKCYKY